MGRAVAIKNRRHGRKRPDSLEIPRRKGASYRLPVANLDKGSLTGIWDSNRRQTDESADSVPRLGSSRATQDALLRLAANPQDACALVTVYDSYSTNLRSSAIRWFRRDSEVRRVINSILVAIGRQAGSYDPHSMNASEWVSRVADAEARRLRAAFISGSSRGRRKGRAT